MQETGVRFLGQEDPLEKEMATCPVFLPRKSHGQRRLAGYILWGRRDLDLVTKQQQQTITETSNTVPGQT